MIFSKTSARHLERFVTFLAAYGTGYYLSHKYKVYKIKTSRDLEDLEWKKLEPNKTFIKRNIVCEDILAVSCDPRQVTIEKLEKGTEINPKETFNHNNNLFCSYEKENKIFYVPVKINN